ncbi:hypothetical protein [Luteimonas sp. MC1572]|uniref:hypothetical protein n=1 Tax=Luteimonas sp. MC1572 TaxID=2799325 RepID=UPI0018F0BBFE|nr:hypothetical protein [Luteimonas sp. MC1572]MBJ6981952.1 hypothetical protein [Luteimonas sp. MC1572]QQO03227.1 hypothetical protein JGR64_00125 [Luteimonas sp. MC1572]
MDWLNIDLLIPVAVAGGVVVGGARLINSKSPSLATRVLIGLILLGIGIGCGYYLIYIVQNLQQHPLLFGLAAGATGLGINQAAAPLRIAFGSAA